MPISDRMSAQAKDWVMLTGFFNQAWWGEPRIKQESATEVSLKVVKDHVLVVSDKNVQIISTQAMPVR